MKLEKISELLTALTIMTPRQRRAFFELATAEQLRMMEELFLNLLKNPVGISKRDLATARKYKSHIQKLANTEISKKRKKRILNQKGGFLTALIPILGSLLGAFLPR